MQKTQPGQRSGWSCDGLSCKSSPRPSEGWHSQVSNFDLCLECMKIEKRIRIQIEYFFDKGINLWRNLDKTSIV